jgi:hypothetical protein
LESAITQGLRQSISGDVISKNPWCEITRSISNANLKLEVTKNMEHLSKAFKKTPVKETESYRIFQLQMEFDEYLKSDNNEDEGAKENVTFNAFGFEFLMEYVSPGRLREL